MVTRLFLVRHCQATGQAADAPLTPEGGMQAEQLADFLGDAGVDLLVSSPFTRAHTSIAPLALRFGLEIEIDARLSERKLSDAWLPDWREHFRASFDDVDLCLPGGESSRAATTRAVAALENIQHRAASTAVIVTHGNLLTLILRSMDPRFGYADWRTLTNPDVFQVEMQDGRARIERIWKADQSGST